jgi:glycine cleavage system H protein
MKELHELQFPDSFLYFEEHTWVQKDGDNVKVGISDYAQDRLGDVVFVELPEPGATFSKGDAFGTVESVKSISELYMPVSGSIVSVNTSLEENPELVNRAPYSEGWLIVLKPSDDTSDLMDAAGYLEMLKGLA